MNGLHASLMLPVSVLSLQNPDIVLVHYLNVPAIEDCGKPCGPILCSINTDKKEWAKWTKEELIGQLKPMCEYLAHLAQGPALEARPARCGRVRGPLQPSYLDDSDCSFYKGHPSPILT